MFSGHHPGLEGRELPLILRPAVTYRNNEDKLRGEVTDRAEAWVSEERGETQRGGREDRRKHVIFKLQRVTETKQLTAISVVKIPEY